MVRLGADVSLDRQPDPDSRLLLYARNLAAAVSSSRVPECVAGAERRAVSGGTPPDSTVRPPLPAARRHFLQREPRNVGRGLSGERFLEDPRKIQQFALLSPPLGDKGPNRVATVLSKQTLVQQALAESLGLEQLCSTHRG